MVNKAKRVTKATKDFVALRGYEAKLVTSANRGGRRQRQEGAKRPTRK